MSRVWKGQASLERRLKAIASPKAQKLLGGALKEAGDLVGTYAQKLITTGSVSGKDHVASAPGEPPNNDSGTLANGIEVSPPIDNRGEIEVRVTSNAPYSAALEDGSSRSAGASSRSFAGKTSPYGPNKAKQGPVKVEFGDSTTAARPFMRPARDAKKREARKRFAQQVEKIIQGAAD